MGFKKNSDINLHTNQGQGLKFKPFLWYLLKYILVESRRGGGGCVWEEGGIACARLLFQLRRLEWSHLEDLALYVCDPRKISPAWKSCFREQKEIMIFVSVNKAVAMCEWHRSIDISYFHFLVVHPWITKHKRVFPSRLKIAFGSIFWHSSSMHHGTCHLNHFAFPFILPQKWF